MTLNLLHKHLHMFIVVLLQRPPKRGAVFAALGCFFVVVLVTPQRVIFFRESVNQVVIPVFHYANFLSEASELAREAEMLENKTQFCN